MMLHRTPEFHSLLQSVADEHIVHHSGTCAWPRGWSWVSGGHMTEQTQIDVDSLWHAGLITFTTPVDTCGNKALLTFAGSERLSEWNVRFPVNPYSTGGAA